jgi:hypothetical protein
MPSGLTGVRLVAELPVAGVIALGEELTVAISMVFSDDADDAVLMVGCG